jgi:hypothetical protein
MPRTSTATYQLDVRELPTKAGERALVGGQEGAFADIALDVVGVCDGGPNRDGRGRARGAPRGSPTTAGFAAVLA